MSQIPRGPGVGGGSRLAQMQAQFQQKQMQEKEAKLLQMLDSQQQKALQKAGLNGTLPPSNRYMSNSNSNLVNNNNNNLVMNGNVTSNVGAGKVRQMFEERRRHGGTLSSNSSNGYGSRNGALTGIDKGHPLEPLVVTNTSSKSRSSSSKSDPANYATSNGSAMRNTQVPPIMKPANLGSHNRATSLNREQKSKETPAPAPNHTSNNSFNNQPHPNGTVSSANSNANSTGGGGGKPYQQRQQQKSNASHPPPPPPVSQTEAEDFLTPHTTKYSDYAQELEKRENALASKLKRAQISSPDDNASSGVSGSPNKSPTQRSGNVSPTRPNSKSPTTMSTPGSRTSPAPRLSVSSGRAGTTPTASYIRKTGVPPSKVIKSKPSAPPRSTAGPPPGLEECKVCGRYFAPDRIQKHESICKKTTTKKRKVFDPTKMRMLGTEAEPYIRVVSAKPPKAVAPPTTKKADWRKKHEEFIATIRAAKEYQAHVAKGGDPKDMPPPPPSDNSDYIQCPYCNRKFSEGAAERHIPKCKNIKSNKRH